MRLQALLKLRCPHCLKGQVFTSLLKMNETCPVCGIKFEREDGYWMMSVFIGYVLGVVVALPAIVILYLNDAPILWYVIVTGVLLTFLAPWLFRYSRLIWLHLDELFDPRDR